VVCQSGRRYEHKQLEEFICASALFLLHRCAQAAQQQKQAQHHHHHQPGQPPPFNQAEFWRSAFRAAPREVQCDLEMSFVERVRQLSLLSVCLTIDLTFGSLDSIGILAFCF
jgi:hypothetical protein